MSLIPTEQELLAKYLTWADINEVSEKKYCQYRRMNPSIIRNNLNGVSFNRLKYQEIQRRIEFHIYGLERNTLECLSKETGIKSPSLRKYISNLYNCTFAELLEKKGLK